MRAASRRSLEARGERRASSTALALAMGAAALMLGATAVSCGSTCSRNPDVEPTPFRGGETDLDAGFYESSPPEGPFLHFPPGRTYLLEHGLGEVPVSSQIFVSFEESPMPSPDEPYGEGASNFAQAAGNQAVVEHVTAEHLRVRNDTCADLYLRAVIWGR